MSVVCKIIRRGRLLRLASQKSESRILYVQAPAGFGKTVFAVQWMENRKEPCSVSVMLDEYDNNVEDFCRKLKGVPDGLCADADKQAVSVYAGHPDFDKAPAEFLMRAAAAVPEAAAGSVVIDDFHYITAPDVQKVLQDFLGRLPVGVKICILSRSALPEACGGLVLKNEIQFILPEQMLFDSGEICELYMGRKLKVTKKQAEQILEYTEGWPIGVNALLLSENKIPDERMPEDWLEGFLRMQVWNKWDEKLREFMVGICMEEKVSEELCNALTGEEDSGRILNKLQEEGAFLYRQNDGSYRFHNLFREFLKDIFSDRPEEYRVRQIRTAGKWYQEQKDYYHAIERFVSIQDYEEIIYCFRSLKDMGRAGFDPERVAHDIHIALNEDIAQQYPWLYSLMAYTARNEGRMQDFRNYLDCYYRNYPRVVEQAPERVHEIFFLYMMDSRYSLHDIFKMSADAQVHGAFQGAQGCVTLYFPLYHRSFRDFSELLPGDIDGKIHLYRATLGRLLGEERDMIVECIRSGLYYEQGMLDRAKEAALLALSRLEKGFTPESKFCAMVLLLVINHALGEYGAEKSMQEDIQKMIEEDKAFYLQYNFDAVLLRSRMDFQDTRAAEEWLETRAGEMYGRVYGTLDFFRLYGHFTTARAYIVLGNFDQAVILLEKILEMCRPLKRPRSRSNTSRHLPLMPVWLNIHCAA